MQDVKKEKGFALASSFFFSCVPTCDYENLIFLHNFRFSRIKKNLARIFFFLFVQAPRTLLFTS
jgi:hypothetical protein